MGSSEHPAVDGNLDKPKAEAGGRRTRSLRLNVFESSPQPQADSSSPSRGVSGYPPAPNGRCLRASPCSAPLPGASEHQRRAGLSSFQRLLKLYARDRSGSAFRVSKPPPPRGSHRVVTCWQGTDPYSESTRLGAQLLATPQYSQYSRCCRRRSPELRTHGSQSLSSKPPPACQANPRACYVQRSTRGRCRGVRNRPPARWRVRPWPRGGGSLRVRPRLDEVAWLRTGRSQAKGKTDGGQCASTHSLPWICGTSPSGDGTTLAGNAQSPRQSVQRYGCVSHMR